MLSRQIHVTKTHSDDGRPDTVDVEINDELPCFYGKATKNGKLP